MESTRRRGVAVMAQPSACSLAMVLGLISPKVRMTRVKTTVEMVAPYSGLSLVKNKVPRVAAVMLTILLPTKRVESSRSKSSARRRVASALRLPSSAIFRSLILFREEKAVSVAEKYAETMTSNTSATIMPIELLSIE